MEGHGALTCNLSLPKERVCVHALVCVCMHAYLLGHDILLDAKAFS